MATQDKPKVKNKRSYRVVPITPTPLQYRVAKHVSEVVRGTRVVKTTKELLIGAGVAVTTANKGIQFTHQQGVQQALAELGLTKEFVISALQEDIALKPQRRAFELSIAGKWLGLEQRDKPEHQTTAINNAIIVIQLPEAPRD